MSDDIDKAGDHIEKTEAALIAAAMSKAADIPEGTKGVCDLCGDWFERVVEVSVQNELLKACGRCRDEFKL